MTEKYSSNDDVVRKIIAQTTYSEEVAIQKLNQFNGDFMKVLKDYMGIPEKKNNKPVKSLNQEIYKQIRSSLDSAMSEHRQKNPLDVEQATQNLKESEDRHKQKQG